MSSLATLRRFTTTPPDVERCELCGLVLGAEHQHLAVPAERKLLCACDACTIIVSSPHHAKYRRVPRRIQLLRDFQMTDKQWQNLEIPISIAFFYQSTPLNRIVAFYPGVAGAAESHLSLEAWAGLVAANSLLQTFEPDVEALLVNRMKDAREYYRAPIDECYRLAGLIRILWRGFSGGEEVWQAIGMFFERLKAKGTVTA